MFHSFYLLHQLIGKLYVCFKCFVSPDRFRFRCVHSHSFATPVTFLFLASWLLTFLFCFPTHFAFLLSIPFPMHLPSSASFDHCLMLSVFSHKTHPQIVPDHSLSRCFILSYSINAVSASVCAYSCMCVLEYVRMSVCVCVYAFV